MRDLMTYPQHRHRGYIALLAFLFMESLAIFVWYGLYQQRLRSAEEQFLLYRREVVSAIEERLRQHEQILLGGAGLFEASDAVTRQAWRAYVERLRLARNYPGILGVGYSQVIPPNELLRHIAAIRAQGFPDYTVKPPGARDLYTAIIYLEPFTGRNLAAFGYDMYSQETRRKAMVAAVDNGQTTITGKVKLVQETHGKVQAGFLMYVPVYKKGMPTTTAQERWRALRGFVYSPYRVEDLMAGILGQRHEALDFTLHDLAQYDEESLMFDSAAAYGQSLNPQPRLHAQDVIEGYGHRWGVTLNSRPDFERRYDATDTWWILMLGSAVSLAMLLIIWVLVHRREEAQRLAYQMTEELRADEERLESLNRRFELAAQSAGIGVWDLHLATNTLYWNEQMMELYQMRPEEFSGQPAAWSDHVHPDDLPQVNIAFGQMIAGEGDLDIEFRIVRRDGTVRHIKADARVVGERPEEMRVIGVNYDITPIREAEMELRSSRQLLSNVLQAASEFAIIATDREGLITLFNSGAERMLGYQAGDMVGRQGPAIFFLEEDVAARAAELSRELGEAVSGFRTFVAKAERHGSEQREWNCRHRHGHLIPVALTVSVMRDGEGQISGYLGIAQDISHQRQIESSLREGKEQLDEAQRIARVGSWTLDLRTNQLEWSDEIYRIFEIDKRQFAASYQAFLEAIHPEDRSMVSHAYEMSLRDRLPYEIDHRLLMADGRTKYVQERCETEFDELGKPRLSRGTVQDITLLKQTELAREEQALHTKIIIDNVLDGIITIDMHGTITSSNLAAERIFGYRVEEMVGRNVKMLMPEPYHSQHDGYLQNYLATGVARIIGIGREVTGLRKDRSTFPLELAVSEIHYQGAPLFIGMVRDITERKRVEQMKSEFVSTVSHELRTPLTSISGALGLIAGGAVGTLPDEVQQLVSIAQKNSLRLTHLINDLLDMEKIAAGKLHFDMRPQPLMPLLEQTLQINEGYARQYQVSFVIASRDDKIEVRADSDRLTQVLSNFLSNAAKFSPQGGTVELEVERRNGWVRVTVRDHGAGVPDAFRPLIFQKFSQADSSDTRQKGGTGLGLAITKELVERMGGRVGFTSEAGAGAAFYFELPIRGETASIAPLAGTAQNMAQKAHILVVEDDEDTARLMALFLQRAGYQADIAANGAEALQLLQTRDYLALVLDLRLPDINGLELIHWVRHSENHSEMPIVVASAMVEEGRLAINSELDAVDWLPKPIDETRLLHAIDRVLPRNDTLRPRVLHVEDDEDLHRVIRTMAGGRFDFELATSLHQALSLLALQRFDVVLLDLALPDGSGWEVLQRARQLQPPPRIIILSVTELSAEEAAQVEGALLKSRITPRQLLDALNAQIAGIRQ